MSSYELRTHTFEMSDTGLGIELGYESDDALRAATEAARAQLAPEVRAAVEAVEADVQRAMLGL